jgi:hypothetical protein
LKSLFRTILPALAVGTAITSHAQDPATQAAMQAIQANQQAMQISQAAAQQAMSDNLAASNAAQLQMQLANANANNFAYSQSSIRTLHTVEAAIDPERIRAHVQYLSDDLLEGRYPGLRGGELAAKYIATQFALVGLKPAGDNGTYFQAINFVGMKAIPSETSFSLIPSSGRPSPPPSTSTPRWSSSATASPPRNSIGTTTPVST